MREEIFLTQENRTGDIVGMTAYHINSLKKLEKYPQLIYLKLVGGKIENLSGLQYCTKLTSLEIRLTEIQDFLSLGENNSIKDLTVAGYYEDVVETVCNMEQLESLSVIYGTAKNPGKLKKLENLSYLYLDKVKEFSDLMEILSLKNLSRLKVNAPRECSQEEIDTFLTGINEHLSKNNWIELGLKGYEFHPETLRGMKLQHFAVTSKGFEIN